MFRTVPLSIIRSFSLYTQQDGTGSVLILLASCQQTCITYTIAVCTVKNSLWWTEEMPEPCRVSSKNKLEKLVHLFGFIIRIYHNAQSLEHQKRYNKLLHNYDFKRMPCELVALPVLINSLTRRTFWSLLILAISERALTQEPQSS